MPKLFRHIPGQNTFWTASQDEVKSPPTPTAFLPLTPYPFQNILLPFRLFDC
jgi:hypothetical protein